MNGNKTVLGLVGSPNSEGLTNQLVSAALEGAARAGAAIELVHMADHVVNACRDCLPWVCKTNLKCTYEDANFEILSNKILNCGGLALGTPVYLWDTSAMVKYLILKMFSIWFIRPIRRPASTRHSYRWGYRKRPYIRPAARISSRRIRDSMTSQII